MPWPTIWLIWLVVMLSKRVGFLMRLELSISIWRKRY